MKHTFLNNSHQRAFEIIALLSGDETMSSTEKWDFTLDIAKFCIESALANLRYHMRKNPKDGAHMEVKAEDIKNWIYMALNRRMRCMKKN